MNDFCMADQWRETVIFFDCIYVLWIQFYSKKINDVLWYNISVQRWYWYYSLWGAKSKFHISYLLVIFCCVINYHQTSGFKQPFFFLLFLRVLFIHLSQLELMASTGFMHLSAQSWCLVWSRKSKMASLTSLESWCFSTRPHHRGILGFLTPWQPLGS